MFVSTVSGIEFQAGGCADGVGEDAGVGVVFGQAVDVVLERVERAGGDDAGLAPAAAECFAMAAGLANQIGRAARVRSRPVRRDLSKSKR